MVLLAQQDILQRPVGDLFPTTRVTRTTLIVGLAKTDGWLRTALISHPQTLLRLTSRLSPDPSTPTKSERDRGGMASTLVSTSYPLGTIPARILFLTTAIVRSSRLSGPSLATYLTPTLLNSWITPSTRLIVPTFRLGTELREAPLHVATLS